MGRGAQQCHPMGTKERWTYRVEKEQSREEATRADDPPPRAGGCGDTPWPRAIRDSLFNTVMVNIVFF